MSRGWGKELTPHWGRFSLPLATPSPPRLAPGSSLPLCPPSAASFPSAEISFPSALLWQLCPSVLSARVSPCSLPLPLSYSVLFFSYTTRRPSPPVSSSLSLSSLPIRLSLFLPVSPFLSIPLLLPFGARTSGRSATHKVKEVPINSVIKISIILMSCF